MAKRFGDELRTAMAKRGVGQHRLHEAAGTGSTNAINEWRHGRNLPTLAIAIRLADALEWPKLVEIARQGRMGRCAVDGRPFLNEGGSPKLYCSAECRAVAAKGRPGEKRDEAFRVLRGEWLRVGPPRKQAIGKALTLLEDAVKGHPPADRLQPFKDAVDAMCGQCEPAGYCRTSDCPLRSVSTWPLLAEARPDATIATKAPGRWGREGAREQFAETMRERWASDPARRQRQSEQTRRMRDEDRDRLVEATREGVRRRDQRRAVA